jgi:hypothetical protein
MSPLAQAFERQLPEAGITPDSWMYGFKIFFEKIDLFLTFDELKKAEKHVKYAELRLAEAEEMVKKGKIELTADLMRGYEENIEKSNEIIEKAKKARENVTKIAELVAIATSIHLDVLEDICDMVPEHAKPAIERAKNASTKRNEIVLHILEEIAPEKASEIHFRIAEKRLLKAKEKAKKGEEVEYLIKEYERRINKSTEIAEIAKRLGKNMTALEQLIEEAISIHLDVLSEIHEKVPEEARSAIERAMNVSIKGKERALVEKFGIETTEEVWIEKITEEAQIPTE